MTTTVYNKLVRDKIPEIIERSGRTSRVRVLSQEDFLNALNHKLKEEADEFIENPCEEEIADLLEVIDALIAANGFNLESIMQVKSAKKAERGGFEQFLMLESVETKG